MLTPAEETRRLRLLVDHMPGLIGYWDRERRNVIANDAYREYFGLTPAQVRGMPMHTVLGEAVYALNLPFIDGVLAGDVQLFDRTLVDRHGVSRYTQCSYLPDIVDGEVRGFFVQITDVTARVEAERARDEALRLFHIGLANIPLGHAVVDASGESDLDATLRRIITAGIALTGARHGAVGIHGHDGRATSLPPDGVDADTVRLVGELPAASTAAVVRDHWFSRRL